MRKQKFFKMFLPAMLTVFCFSACGKQNNANEVNIGYFNNITHAQALYMKAQGSLENTFGEEVQVNWTAFNAGPAEVEALFAEDIDIGFIGPVPAITANVKSDGDVVILSGAAKGGAVLLTGKDSAISSVSDLAGKTIAIPQIGNTQHLSLLAVLEEYGLKAESAGGNVRISAVSNADAGNTLERGDVDAALVPEPWASTLLEQGAKLLLDYDEVYFDGTYDVAVVVVRKDFLEENPQKVEAFLEQHTLATQEINENQEEALAVINAELESASGKKLSEDILSKAFARMGICTDLNKESMMGFAQMSKEQGFIREVPTEETLLQFLDTGAGVDKAGD